MKKLVSIILCAMMLIALSACGENIPAAVPLSPNGAADPTAAPTDPPAVTPVPDPSPDPVAYPRKAELTAEEQAIADRYYEQLKDVCPEFYAIPRELIYEKVFIDSDGDVTVDYWFCLGGCRTDYRWSFDVSPVFPEGNWTVFGEEFAPYADRVLTEGQMASIKGMLYDSVSSWINERRLEAGDLSAENTVLFWIISDGKLCADTEVIANVGPDTVGNYGCLSHAHVFGSVCVEFTESGAELTALNVNGG